MGQTACGHRASGAMLTAVNESKAKEVRALKMQTVCRTVLALFLVLVFCTPVFLHVSHTHHDAHACMACPICVVANRLQALLLQLIVAFLLLRTALPVCMNVQHAAQKGKLMQTDTLVVLNIRMNN